MTWTAWRVQRPQFLAAIAATVLFGVWLAITGAVMGHDQHWKYWTVGNIYVLYALPGILGLAIGAPLVAEEITQHTVRLAWSQSITKSRWITDKLLCGGTLAVLLTALLTLLLEWWTGAVSLAASTNSGGFSGVRIQPSAFDLTGIVIVAYVLFAYGLGVALGTLIRRPGWTFAAGTLLFAATRIAIQQWVRPMLLAPKTVSNLTGFSIRSISNGWLLNEGILPTGRSGPAPGQSWTQSAPAELSSCINSIKAQTPNVFENAQAQCAKLAHIHYVMQFQPSSHYWPLQVMESAIFVAMAVVLLAISIQAVRTWRA